MQAPLSGRHRTATNLVGIALLVGLTTAGHAASVGNADAIHEHPQQAVGGEPMEASADVRRTLAQYLIPNVTLIRDDGQQINLPAELDDGRPVVLNFIYTSCTTICPMSSQTFALFQHDLGSAHEPVHLVSISIDPEQDTPARLRAYAAQFRAQRGWDHYSGDLTSILAVQKAFNAYFGDKMSHTPLTLVRAAPGKPWVRFDGFARVNDLLGERKAWIAPAAIVAAK